MRKILKNLLVITLTFGIFGIIQSCKTGEGCGLEEKYAPGTDKDGNLKKAKRKKAKLF
jgi:hypothetical protein